MAIKFLSWYLKMPPGATHFHAQQLHHKKLKTRNCTTRNTQQTHTTLRELIKKWPGQDAGAESKTPYSQD